MATPEEQWWSIRTAEYLLGTLTKADHNLFEKILEHDTNLQLETALWAQRLAGLNETTKAITPNAHVWDNIRESVQQDKYRAHQRTETGSGAVLQSEIAKSSDSSTVPYLSAEPARRAPPATSTLWKTIAAVSTAASVVLGILLLQNKFGPDANDFNTDGVAVVLNDESGAPHFLIETDYLNAKVRVTTLTPPELQSSDALHLWQAAPDRSSVKHVSRLSHEVGVTVVFESTTLIEGSDLFGVSIEPIGTSTSGGPLGPVVAHGDFLKTRTSD